MILCCTRHSVSRENIVAAEQSRSLPEVFGVNRQSLWDCIRDCKFAQYQKRGRYRPSVRRSRWRQVYSIRICRRSSEQDFGAHGLTSDMQLHWAAQVSQEIVRSQSLCGSSHTGCERLRPVKRRTSSRFSRGDLYQNFCRLRVPAGNCFRGSRRVRPISRLADGCVALHRCSSLRRGARDAAASLSCQLAQPHREEMCLPASILSEHWRNQLQFWPSSEALAYWSGSSGWINVCGSNENGAHRGFQRRRNGRERAPATGRPCPQVERILCIHLAYPVLITAALERRVREDLINLPEECGS